MIQDFEKWHGCGNDFIICWIPEDDLVVGALESSVSRLCTRDGTGIGADGLIAMVTSGSRGLDPRRTVIWNKDGSEATTCGNGLRCASLSTLRRHRRIGNVNELPDFVDIPLDSGSVTCRFHTQGKLDGDDRHFPSVVVSMGSGKTGPDAHGFALVDEFAKAELGSQNYSYCEFPNPHIVIDVENFSRAELMRLGSKFQNISGVDGVNVHLVREIEPSESMIQSCRRSTGSSPAEAYEVLVWERGVGPTPACGSGACAVATHAMRSGMLSPGDSILVSMPGGDLFVTQNSGDGSMVLSGPATYVFEGKFEL